MMQPILLTTPSSSASDSQIAGASLEQSVSLEQQGKSAGNFSGLFGTAIEGTTKNTNEGGIKDSEGAKVISAIATPIAQGAESSKASKQLANSNNNSATTAKNTDNALNSEGAIAGKMVNSASAAANSQQRTANESQPLSILAQIEAALNIDTKLSEPANKVNNPPSMLANGMQNQQFVDSPSVAAPPFKATAIASAMTPPQIGLSVAMNSQAELASNAQIIEQQSQITSGSAEINRYNETPIAAQTTEQQRLATIPSQGGAANAISTALPAEQLTTAEAPLASSAQASVTPTSVTPPQINAQQNLSATPDMQLAKGQQAHSSANLHPLAASDVEASNQAQPLTSQAQVPLTESAERTTANIQRDTLPTSSTDTLAPPATFSGEKQASVAITPAPTDLSSIDNSVTTVPAAGAIMADNKNVGGTASVTPSALARNSSAQIDTPGQVAPIMTSNRADSASDYQYTQSTVIATDGGLTAQVKPVAGLVSNDALATQVKPAVEFVSNDALAAQDKPTAEFTSNDAFATQVKPAAEFVSNDALAGQVKPAAEFVSNDALAAQDKPTAGFTSNDALATQVKPAAEFVSNDALAAQVKPAAEFTSNDALTGKVKPATEFASNDALAAQVQPAAEFASNDALAGQVKPATEFASNDALAAQVQPAAEFASHDTLAAQVQPAAEFASNDALAAQVKPVAELANMTAAAQVKPLSAGAEYAPVIGQVDQRASQQNQALELNKGQVAASVIDSGTSAAAIQSSSSPLTAESSEATQAASATNSISSAATRPLASGTFTAQPQGQVAAELDSSLNEQDSLQPTTKFASIFAGEQKSGIGNVTVTPGQQPLNVDAMVNGDGEPLALAKDKGVAMGMANLAQEQSAEVLTGKGAELERNTVNHVGDPSGLRANDINAASLHKLGQHIAPSMHNANALQQPVDIHNKQAAAILGERVLMMLNQGKQEIQIRLDPAELGSMHIKLNMQQDQLQLSIQTDASQSKDIIEQNLPRLREQLAQQGISLGNTSIEQQARGQQQSSNQQGNSELQNRGNGSSAESGSANPDEQIAMTDVKIPLSAQGIDYYA